MALASPTLTFGTVPRFGVCRPDLATGPEAVDNILATPTRDNRAGSGMDQGHGVTGKSGVRPSSVCSKKHEGRGGTTSVGALEVRLH